MKVLLLGGTSEARELAAVLDGEAGMDVVTSLAGRVREPVLPLGSTRTGGFGGPEGLSAWLDSQSVDVLVDATHPFATVISKNARSAACAARIPLIQLVRPPWRRGVGDRWTEVSSLHRAAEVVESTARRAFLTIGRQGVNAFAECSTTWFLVRSIDPPSVSMPPRHRLVLARGPFDVQHEISLMTEHGIECLVTKNSGGLMTEAKLIAARSLRIPVVMVERPSTPVADVVVNTAEDATAWLRAHL
ncbi:cobalt-precorrin-6A reductase [Rhodococcus sp. P1Y]|uniref:cobalt-precorrin-6A reductase n=1 Tax=Rhodococcus sp. P1Y TaxID=1302308 RepID=UPI001F3F8551|nr:cobalt-precorrin-6A reductase [Rhodococcus sp. P1Y]